MTSTPSPSSPTTIALMMVRDRRATVERCLPAWAQELRPAGVELWCVDDSSTTLSRADLRRWGADRAVLSLAPLGLEKGERVAAIIRASLALVLEERPDAEWVFVVDSDTYPTPGVGAVMGVLQRDPRCRVVSLYRSGWQEAQRHPAYRTTLTRGTAATVPGAPKGRGRLNLLTRERAPGCALLLRTENLRGFGPTLGVGEAECRTHAGSWDHALAHAFGRVEVVETSLVEHLGRGGVHNSDWNLDRAHNPTPALALARPQLIGAIEKAEREGLPPATAAPTIPPPTPPVARRPRLDNPPAADRQAAYHPQRYWAERLAEEGPCYVGVGGEKGSAAQSAAFWNALQPVLEKWIGMGTCPVLDFGCGTGRLSGRFRELGYDYRGVDVNPGALEVARKRHPTLRYAPATLPLPFRDAYFTLAVAVTVLQHVPERDLPGVAGEIRRVVRPGGWVVLVEDANPEGAVPAPHMAFRTPETYAVLLGGKVMALSEVTAERPRSHYLAAVQIPSLS